MTKRSENNRSHSTIGSAPPNVKAAVERMISDGKKYREIAEYLRSQEIILSKASICRYAKRYMKTVEQLHAAQENFRAVLEEIERYPELDTTEALLRISSHKMLGAVLEMKDADIKELAPGEVLGAVNSLTKAMAYKKQIDIRGRSEYDKARESYKALLFSTIAKRRPDLYQQLLDLLNEEDDEQHFPDNGEVAE